MANDLDDRKKFLIEMYNQLWTSLNTRFTLMWESISVIIGAFAIYALVEKDVIPLDYAVIIMVILVCWFEAHIIDMAYWYNRNLAMITNIEKQFLTADDKRLIHPYFKQHRGNKMISYYKIQFILGISLLSIVLLFQWLSSVQPMITSNQPFTFIPIIPYLFLVIGIIFLIFLWCDHNKKYSEFILQSPGKEDI